MVKTTTLGGTAADVVVVKVAVCDSAAHMRFVVLNTLRLLARTHDNDVSCHLCCLADLTIPAWHNSIMAPFETIKSGIDALPPGAKMVLNSCKGTSWLRLRLDPEPSC